MVCCHYSITIDDKRAEISLNNKVHPEKWDKESVTLKGNALEIKILNNHLLKVKTDLNVHFINLSAIHQTVSPQLLSDTFLGKETKPLEKTLL
jgi:hypothetical protein